MSRRRKTGLFYEYWYSLDGRELRRATRAELAEAYRLWAVHADIRESSAPANLTTRKVWA